MIATGLRGWPETVNAARHNTTAGMYLIGTSTIRTNQNTAAGEEDK
jgi:hypothetical protein